MLAFALAGHLERELENTIDTAAGEHRLLQHELVFSVFEHDPAQRRVLAFGVFAHHDEVDVTRLAIGKRAGYAGEQANRADVGVLVELAAKLEQRAPQGNVIGHFVGPAYGTEENRIKAFQLFKPVVRHHLAVLQVVIAVGPFKIVEFQLQSVFLGGSLNHAHAFGQYFQADAVSGNSSNAQCLVVHIGTLVGQFAGVGSTGCPCYKHTMQR
ncbi:hypothetical protein BV330_04544 [Pseudomonas syringae pv. actinidiae]|nr:hypothetical protein BV330_04544 [Pseudomonas syringae pv. actinidiae]OSR89287.1 hypothetical protein BV331_04636 [Pseudomonas syringae pv. actinidiae]